MSFELWQYVDPVAVPNGIAALETLLIHLMFSHYMPSMKGSLLEVQRPVRSC